MRGDRGLAAVKVVTCSVLTAFVEGRPWQLLTGALLALYGHGPPLPDEGMLHGC